MSKIKLIGILSFLLLQAFFLPACEPGTRVLPTPSMSSSFTFSQSPSITKASISTNTRTTSPTRRPTSTSTRTSTSTSVPIPTPTLAFIRSAGTDGNWIRYNHTLYGIAFSAPPGWIISEVGTNFIHISSPFDHNIKLTVGIKWSSEDVRIQRTGVSEGEILQVGEVPFYGENISKGILVFQGRDKLILYHNCTEIKVGERVFTLGFSDFNTDYDEIDLAPLDVQIADGIVESFGYPE